MSKYISMLMLAAVAAALGVGAVQAADDAPKGPQIGIFNYKFDPETLTVAVGTTVTWVNKDEVPHTIASSDKKFKASGGLDTGDSYSYTFAAPGTYEYFCTIHPFMKGKIVVTAN